MYKLIEKIEICKEKEVKCQISACFIGNIHKTHLANILNSYIYDQKYLAKLFLKLFLLLRAV